MATTTTITGTGLAAPRRFTVAEYHRMVEAGILDEDDRIELICGEIIELSPIGRGHLSCTDKLTMTLAPALSGRAIVRVQGSFQLADDGEPEPDLLVLRWRDDFYAESVATPEDVLLIMEVAGSSLEYDRAVKARLYGEAMIPEYWLWDLDHRVVLVHREPGQAGYGTVTTVGGREPLSPLSFPDLSLTPEDIFPRPHEKSPRTPPAIAQ